jgi:hypothetical protein
MCCVYIICNRTIKPFAIVLGAGEIKERDGGGEPNQCTNVNIFRNVT